MSNWILPSQCSLRYVNEEALFFLNRPADLSSVLISLEEVLLCREKRPAVEFVVAHKLEQAPVKIVRARLRHRVQCSAGVKAILRGQGTGFEFEFLQCVRKRK